MTGADAIAAAMVVMSLALIGYAVVSLIEARRRKKRKVAMFVVSHATERASMKEASMIGLDLSKRSFQAHGALADGSVAFRKKLTREKVVGFLAEQPRCTVAMEAAGAHITGVGLSATPGMIVEAASRPTMRFVAVKTEEQQARAMLFRTRISWSVSARN